MDKAKMAEFKTMLAEKRKEVIKQLESVGHKAENGKDNYNAEFPDYGDSMEDNAIEVADYAKNLSLEKDLEKELNSIDKAVKAIESGSYGVCKHCNEDIEIERLKIRPESNSCIKCKKALKNQI
jgi:RNA polymerase-binding protein DksA